MPHEHGATEQTRAMRRDVPTLAQRMEALGYRPQMVTANVVTTDIFGLDRGFDAVDRVWRLGGASEPRGLGWLAVLGKPRLRQRLVSKDLLMGKLTEDLGAAGMWVRSTMQTIFARTRTRLEDSVTRGRRSFLFLNLVETHFPYHVADTFETSAAGAWQRLRELHSLYHLVNQTWLTRDREYIDPDMRALLRQRQRLAWQRLAGPLDEFMRELREHYGALVVFTSDHGENFGEQGWLYHFSNVTDAGNRVPLFWLDPARDEPRVEATPVTTRDLFGALLRAAGDRDPALRSCVDEPERSLPVMQAYWYNNRGRTLPQFRHNQFAFVAGGRRFVHRPAGWSAAPITRLDEPELPFQPLARGINPLHEAVDEPERLARLRRIFADYETFAKGNCASS
jgi:arylsulfatase A-like enzyme